jgi:hypothetical protein
MHPLSKIFRQFQNDGEAFAPAPSVVHKRPVVQASFLIVETVVDVAASASIQFPRDLLDPCTPQELREQGKEGHP